MPQLQAAKQTTVKRRNRFKSISK